MNQGPREARIIKECARAKMPLPKAIANAPSLHLGLELYMQGFNDLDSSRIIGMVEGPIPWGAVQAYCDSHELDDEQTANMHHHIREMDAAFLEERAKKRS